MWKVPRPEQARQHLTAAATMYREMGMRVWLDQLAPSCRRQRELEPGLVERALSRDEQSKVTCEQ